VPSATASGAPPVRVAVVGVPGGGVEALGSEGRARLESASLIVAGHRLLEQIGDVTGTRLALEGETADVLAAIEETVAGGGRACVLASGDPGFFGIVRLLAERLGPGRLEVLPAPSAVSLAFARIGLPWDDAVVISAHGRPLAQAVEAAVASGAAKLAFLTAPGAPPEELARALLAAGAANTRAVVATSLGSAAESVAETTLSDLARGSFDWFSVVIVLAGDGLRPEPSLIWPPEASLGADTVRPRKVLSFGADEDDFEHRDSMVTKPEVRSVVLARLMLPVSGVLWDIGAGSGSVGIEAAALAPGLRVLAFEKRTDDADRIRANAHRLGVTDRVMVVGGNAPESFEGRPAPDRAFVGGGGLELLDAVLERMQEGARVVATFAAMDRAAAASSRLGNLVQLHADRGHLFPDGGVRLEAGNPVFIVWGDAR
jgi:precorrin-6B C5,15-methyltransferase / cobalt-precorrin-6B C5,C15-methyltransferase